MSLSSVLGKVEFPHVRFGYRPDKIIIHDFSVTVKAGQTVAVVHHTGAGKRECLKKKRILERTFHKNRSGDPVLCGRHSQPVLKSSAENAFTGESGLKADVFYGKPCIL